MPDLPEEDQPDTNPLPIEVFEAFEKAFGEIDRSDPSVASVELKGLLYVIYRL